jgi:hypothetical protein
MLARACGRYSAPNKHSFRSDHHSQPTDSTPPVICLRARWAIAKRHEVVERRAMARQQDLNEIYGAAAWLENTGRGIEWVFC